MKTQSLIHLSKLFLFAIGLTMVSCSEDSSIDQDPTTDSRTQLVTKYFQGEKIQVIDNGDGTYTEGGDIILTESQVTDVEVPLLDTDIAPSGEINPKLGLAGGIRKWPNNTVVYVLDRSLTSNQIQVTRNSMEEWSTKTNVRFKERTNENYYVTIKNDNANCNCGRANLGVNGTSGIIIIGTRTTEYVMIHEIGHTLGFIHEQTRSDRDDHVRIRFENIQGGAESQFRKNTRGQNIGAFDIESTMMYGPYTFSKNGQPTITKLDGSVYRRRSAALSSGDIAGTNQVYPGSTTTGGGDTGGGDTGGDTITCDGVENYVSGKDYQVGDRVIYEGYLYERDFTRWNRIKECDTTTAPSTDICEGVAAYNPFRSYGLGDKVTFRGFLYEVEQTANGLRWVNQGQCGN